MQIAPINSCDQYKQPSFKKMILDKNAKKIINSFTEAEKKEFQELSDRISKTRFWDLELSGYKNYKEEYAFLPRFYLNKNRKRTLEYVAGVSPSDINGNLLEITSPHPVYDDDSVYENLKFPTKQRAKEIYDYCKNRTHQLYSGDGYKTLTVLDELKHYVYSVEYMEESYQYMDKVGFAAPIPKIYEHSFVDDLGKDHTIHCGSGNTGKVSTSSKSDAMEAEKIQFDKATDFKKGLMQNKRITFDSVGGQDKAIDILKKKVLYPIMYPQAFKNRMLTHGIILYGKPGTGKTLLALALSNECGANFIKINASDLTSSLHGQTETNWRELFAKASKSQPCIVFIDEFDTVAAKRGHNASNNYDDVALNQILAEMSDLEKRGDNVFIIAATNRFGELDEAAKRAGRFGTHIEIKAPETEEEVIQIFDIHTLDKNLEEDVDKTVIAKEMLKRNATGADIANIVNEAIENTFLRKGIYQKMENGTFENSDMAEIRISMQDFNDAIKTTYGKKSENRTIGF